jgi:hypothetical protein
MDIFVIPSGEDGVGATDCLKEGGLGLKISRPKFLRTRAGDLHVDVKGGGESILQTEDVLGLLDAGSGGPCLEGYVEPIQCDMGNRQSSVPLSYPVSNKRGRIKKPSKKPLPFHPYRMGNKQQLVYEMSKGGAATKRKGGGRGGVSCSRTSSTDSDPIANSHSEGRQISSQQVHDVDGILLEVVIPSSMAVLYPSFEGAMSVTVPGGGGIRDSGLAGLIGEQGHTLNGESTSD